VGGGTHPRPGEVTLAHRGVLFLDEFPEFERRSIDALRQPLEDRVVRVSRVQGTATFPSDFILLAAMNPHRGGFESGDLYAQVTDAYKKKLSGPILDRIDIALTVEHIAPQDLTKARQTTDETKYAREAVAHARNIQRTRLAGRHARANAEMTARDIEETLTLTPAVETLINTAASKMHLSPRSIHRTIKVARTIADLAAHEHISEAHLLEALQYRVKL
jgi:magnesium chelatase family protein